MDRTCLDCDVVVSTGVRCKSHAAFARWRNRSPDYTPPRCKVCDGEITSRSRYRAVYCSIKCKFADPQVRAKMGPPRRGVERVCPACQRTFYVSRSQVRRYDYCSIDCSRAARGVDATCARCGSAFRHARLQRRRHCCEACRRPPVTIDCAHCGTHFRIVPSAAARKRFCSVRCYRASGAETSIERRVREVLEALAYSHRPQAQIGPWVVDFLVGDRLVIEADGAYWHAQRPDVDRRKTTDLSDRDYVVWRIGEVEIIAEGFPTDLQRRLVDYEVANGEIPRMAPQELVAIADQHGVVPRQSKRSARKVDPNQILLDLGYDYP